MKLRHYILSLFVCFLILNNVYAEEYKYNRYGKEFKLDYDPNTEVVCSYPKFSQDYVLIFNTSNQSITTPLPLNTVEATQNFGDNSTSYAEWTYDTTYLKEYWFNYNPEKSCLDKILLCSDTSNIGFKKTKYTFIIDSTQEQQLKDAKVSLGSCYEVTERNASEDAELSCSTFDILKSKLENSYSNYKDGCENEYADDVEKQNICKSESYSESATLLDKLKKTCRSLLSNKDYGEDSCVDNCLNLEETVNQLKESYGINVENENICGFSERLIIWIANIVRWIKYIIPVVVIVLGILDFIKAIATDKDDEMKKAQKRFIIRLIAAALIFIVPFIIEFVLDKMGFTANGCGIINL